MNSIMTPIKYNNNNFLLSYQLQYMLDIRKVVEDGKDWKDQQRLWKDYPCVASVCSRNFRIGKGYSKNCAKVLKAKRPKQLNQQVANRITNYISSITVKNGKDEYGRKIYNGTCAEDMAATDLLNQENGKFGIPTSANFTQPQRVRSGEYIDMCIVCQNVFK